jgi:4'-phosphopantetheinyl transferase
MTSFLLLRLSKLPRVLMQHEFFSIQAPTWCRTIAPPSLRPNELHVWRANLDQPEPVLRVLGQSLSEDERAKTERLRFAHHRQRAIASRGILRALLSHYLNLAPEQIQFCYTATGKPGLCQSEALPAIAFNVSHSQNLALYAITTNTPVGIDVEAQRALSMFPQLVQNYFSPTEQRIILAPPPEIQEHRFYYFWTAKEALTKATGRGIADLAKVEITIQAQRLQAHYDQLPPSTNWHIISIEPHPGFAATVAYATPEPRQLLFLDWEMDGSVTF